MTQIVQIHEPQEGTARVRAINAAIRREDSRLRARHRWLQFQDGIGLSFFLGSLGVVAFVAWQYLAGHLPAWFCVIAIAVAVSILHELEHDLIHGLYFRNNPFVTNLLFFGIWFAKQGNNPWRRRPMHIRHHSRSGQHDDIEERSIGLGVPLGPRRLLSLLVLGALVLVIQALRGLKKENPEFVAEVKKRIRTSPYFPLPFVVDTIFGLLPLVVVPAALAGWSWARVALVLFVLPNLVRHACLVLMSSYSHYYEIAANDVFLQNQILSHWIFYPLQLFCFNFGSTHIIHHYVVDQPFYLRQMVARAAHREMLRQGVLRNDFGVFLRANRRPANDSPDVGAPTVRPAAV